MRYQYQCDSCDNKFEADLPVDDRDRWVDKKCPECHGNFKRSIGNSGGFRLLGGGWESDGYTGLYGNSDEFKKNFGKGD